MKRFLSTASAVVAVAAACGFAATTASASALSLGPAGTKITGKGAVNRSFGFRGFYFSGLEVTCDQVTLSGTLNGSASVTAAHTFSQCKAISGATGAATASAPGGLKLTVLQYETRPDGTTATRGQMSTTPGGLTVTVGNCTLTWGPNLDLVPLDPHDGQMLWGIAKDGPQAVFMANDSVSSYTRHPYTGSSGCPTAQRGTHTSGSGLGFYDMGITSTPPS